MTLIQRRLDVNDPEVIRTARQLDMTPQRLVEMRLEVVNALRKCATEFGPGSCRSARLKARSLLRRAGEEPPPEDPRDARPAKGNERVPAKRPGRRR